MNGEMGLQLYNDYTLTDYILSDLPILRDFFRMGLFFLAGSFSVLLPLSTFTWQIERWISKQTGINVFCASLLFQAKLDLNRKFGKPNTDTWILQRLYSKQHKVLHISKFFGYK